MAISDPKNYLKPTGVVFALLTLSFSFKYFKRQNKVSSAKTILN